MDHSNSAGIRRHKLGLSLAALMAFISPAAGVDVSTYALGAKKQALDSTVETVSAGYYAATTLSAVDTDLAAGNIKPGVTIFGFAGNYTGDADAIAADIIMGKTAYVNGVKLTGTLTTQSLSAANDTVTAGNYTATTLSAVDTDLAAGNIKSGIGIFGINGSLLPSGGTAGPADVVSGKTFYGSGQSDWTLQTGSLVNFTPGWGADVNGNPSNISWWPVSFSHTGVSQSATVSVYPLARSSPLYVYGRVDTDTTVSFNGAALKILTGEAQYGFLSTSVAKDTTTAKSLYLADPSNNNSISLQSVLYGSIRKLVAGTDYSEELRGADNLTKGWAWDYSPVPSDFSAMNSVAGPYPNLHDENSGTNYNGQATGNSCYTFIHKVTFNSFSEDALRLYGRGIVGCISGRASRFYMNVWNYSTSVYDSLIYGTQQCYGGDPVKVLDIAKNSNYIQGDVMWIMTQSWSGNNNADQPVNYFRDFDLWAAYKNPQD